MRNPVQADATGLPEPCRSSVNNLSAFTIAELVALHEAYRSSAATFLGFQNQPRCEGWAILNRLEDETDRAYQICIEILAELARRRPTDAADADRKTRLLVTVALQDDRWAHAMHMLAAVLREGGTDA